MVCLYHSNDGVDVTGSILHNVNKDLVFGALLSWSAGANTSSLSIGAQYSPESDVTYRVSILLCIVIGEKLPFTVKKRCSLVLTL